MNTILRSVSGVKNLTHFISRDWMLKFISLILAIILWFYVGGEDRVDKNVMIPVEIINLPRDLVISNQFKKEIEVSVSGPRALILEMNKKAVTRQVDLSSATPGSMVIENGNHDIPVPRGVTVQRVQPSSIILSLDKLVQKELPVSARTVGRLADGYYIKSLKTEPNVITITGPLTTLSMVDELFTKAINLSGVKSSAQLQVPLELDPVIVELIGETSVTANLVVGVETETVTIENAKVYAVIGGEARDVVPPVVEITANIPKKILTEGRNITDLFSVTVVEIEGDSEKLEVAVIPKKDVAESVEVLSVFPKTVRLVNDDPLPMINAAGPVAGFSVNDKKNKQLKELARSIREQGSGKRNSGIPIIHNDRPKIRR